MANARYQKHRRNIQTLVIMAYIAFSIADAIHSVLYEGSLWDRGAGAYGLLGVEAGASGSTVRRAFRKLSLAHHPDKAGSDNSNTWMLIKEAYEMLTSVPMRFAYQRFGSSAMSWPRTQSEDMMQSPEFLIVFGVTKTMVPFYGGQLLLLVVLWMFGVGTAGKYWRWLLVAAVALGEFMVIIRFGDSTIFGILPFQFTMVLRRIMMSAFVAIYQILPLYESPANSARDVGPELDKLEALVTTLARETKVAVSMELQPFAEPAVRAGLEKALIDKMRDNSIQNDPLVVDAFRIARQNPHTASRHAHPTATAPTENSSQQPASTNAQRANATVNGVNQRSAAKP
jgi:hypothetical protein